MIIIYLNYQRVFIIFLIKFWTDMTTKPPLNINYLLSEISEHWKPTIIDWNDFQFRLVKFQGDFGWHTHDTDKVLLVSYGSMYIDFENQETIKLKEGELYVVPKNISHQPRSDNECAILLIEPLNYHSDLKLDD